MDLGTLRSLAKTATRGRDPDLTFVLDVSVEISSARVAARTQAGGAGADRLEREAPEFHRRVREGYLALARDDPRFVTLDGTVGPSELLETASKVLAQKFEL